MINGTIGMYSFLRSQTTCTTKINNAGVVKNMKKDLISILKKENLKNISEAVGIKA